jgi:hypothetical protein
MRNEAGEVVIIGAGVETAGVEEVHVGIDVAGDDPFPGGIDDDVIRSRTETGGAPDGNDASLLDGDVGVRERWSARSVEERSVQKDDARENADQTILRGSRGFRCMVRS